MIRTANWLDGLQHRLRQVTGRTARSRRRATRHQAAETVSENLEQRLLLSATNPADCEAAAPVTMDMTIGTNVEGVYDWMAGWMFTDAFKHSRDWISHDFNTVTEEFEWTGSQSVQRDDSGWVTDLASWQNSAGDLMQQWVTTLMFHDIGAGNYPAGTYRIEWDGNGTLADGDLVLDGDVTQILTEGTLSDGRHFAEFDVNAAGEGIFLQLRNVDPADPMMNFNVWMSEWEGQSFFGQRDWSPGSDFSPFHPRFLESLEPFEQLRVMQLQGTHEFGGESAFPEDHTVDWSDRRLLSDARQVQSDSIASGVAVEYIVELANATQKDIWVSMPHAATADYVTNFATYVRDNLDPSLTVTVEYSNEIWNALPWFPAYGWITEQIEADPNLTEEDRYTFAASQIREDFEIWESVFTGQQHRIDRVVGSQTANPWITTQLLDNLDGHFDSVAIGGYYLPDYDERLEFDGLTTADDVIDVAYQSIASTVGAVAEHQELLETYELALGREIPLHLYEAGHHFDGGPTAYQTAFSEAAASPRIYDAQRILINGMYDQGVSQFNDYQHTQRHADTPWGNFGSLTSQEESLEDAHKYRSLVDTINGDMIDLTNSRPTVSDIPSFVVTAGDSFSVDFTVGDLETPLESLELIVDSTESIMIPNENLTITGTGANRTLTVQTETELLGRAMVSLLVVDGGYSTGLDTFYVDIVGDGDPPPPPPEGETAPVALHPSFTTPEDTAFEFDLGTAVSDADDPIESLTFEFMPEWLGEIEVLADGRTARFTPTANAHDVIDFWFTATDPDGQMTWGSVTITVTPVNDAPMATDGTYEAMEDDDVWIFVGDIADDLETDLQNLAFQIDATQNGTVTRTADGWNLIFTPDADFNGTAGFDFTVFDDGTPVESASASVTVDVLPVNDIPVALGGALTTTAGTPVTIDLHDYASDLETSDGQLLFEVFGGGELELAADGHTVTFTPEPGFIGEYELWYRVVESEGMEAWNVIRISVEASASVSAVFADWDASLV